MSKIAFYIEVTAVNPANYRILSLFLLLQWHFTVFCITCIVPVLLTSSVVLLSFYCVFVLCFYAALLQKEFLLVGQ